MPELPEVETLCRQLRTVLPGQRIIAVRLPDPKLTLTEDLAGRSITEVERRGKALLIGTTDGPVLRIHLRMSGRLHWLDMPEALPPYARMVITLDRGRLALCDPRRFATVLLEAPEAAPASAPDAFNAPSLAALTARAASRKTPVKSFLLDQNVLSGLGNIYVCEILHGARVHPCRPAADLTLAEWRRVDREMRRILPRAIASRGTSISDWRDLFGCPGDYQQELRIYGQTGRRCRCGGTIERRTLNGRGTFFCPRCQR